MINYVQPGDVLTLTAPYAVASGAGAKIGFLFGVAAATIANGDKGEFAMRGVFDLAKDTSTFAEGDKVFWDDTNKCCTSTTSGNIRIGRAVGAAATGVATVNVLLDQASN